MSVGVLFFESRDRSFEWLRRRFGSVWEEDRELGWACQVDQLCSLLHDGIGDNKGDEEHLEPPSVTLQDSVPL
jgi:hypothetical protein